MESKPSTKALEIFKTPSVRLGFLGFLIVSSLLLFISEDPINRYFHPKLEEKTTEGYKQLDEAYIWEENFQAVSFYFAACFALGMVLFVLEHVNVKNLTKIIFLAFIGSSIFRAISFCDLLHRMNGQYYFQGTLDKLLMIGSIMLASHRYYKIKQREHT